MCELARGGRRQLRLEDGDDVLDLRHVAGGALDEKCALQGAEDEPRG